MTLLRSGTTKTHRQRHERDLALRRLRAHEAALEGLRGGGASGDLEPRLIAVQRKINRARGAVGLPAVRWLETNASDRALRRRLSS